MKERYFSLCAVHIERDVDHSFQKAASRTWAIRYLPKVATTKNHTPTGLIHGWKRDHLLVRALGLVELELLVIDKSSE
jgi:hypothetical protein